MTKYVEGLLNCWKNMPIVLCALWLIFGIPNQADCVISPLGDPVICAYWNIKDGYSALIGDLESPSGINYGSGRDVSELCAAILAMATGKARVIADENVQVASDSSDCIKPPEFAEASTLKKAILEEACYYYSKENEWVFLVFGQLAPEEIAAYFKSDCILQRPNGFSVVRSSDQSEGSSVVLHVGKDFGFVCPAQIEGNIADAVISKSVCLSENRRTFVELAKRKPACAVEIDLENFIERIGKGLIDSEMWMTNVKLFRMIVDSKIVKAQLYIPDTDCRAMISESLKPMLESLSKFHEELDAQSRLPIYYDISRSLSMLTIKNSGTSLFLESPGIGAEGVTAVGRILVSATASLFEAAGKK